RVSLPSAGSHFAADNASLREFEAPLGDSYQCRNRSLALGPGFHVDTLHEQVQAFSLTGDQFGKAHECPEQQRSLVVPIVVGIILLVLIIIIIIAYLVGRRRSRDG
uniref:Uncharacterized protein n=1 Tax=Sphenodon punctatus TaxID=8508 RepID=A0A8D0HPK0_SPHPU